MQVQLTLPTAIVDHPAFTDLVVELTGSPPLSTVYQNEQAVVTLDDPDSGFNLPLIFGMLAHIPADRLYVIMHSERGTPEHYLTRMESLPQHQVLGLLDPGGYDSAWLCQSQQGLVLCLSLGGCPALSGVTMYVVPLPTPSGY